MNGVLCKGARLFLFEIVCCWLWVCLDLRPGQEWLSKKGLGILYIDKIGIFTSKVPLFDPSCIHELSS
jgi:hypothetical protein